MNKPNKVKLGAFILISMILLIGGFIATGIMAIFTPKVKAMTVLNTSVEGLAVGSQVKYLGLPVGRITRIAMRENDGYIAVYFELSPSAIDGITPGVETGSAKNLAGFLQKHSPSCFINAAGLMGGTFLELTLGGGQTAPALPHLTDLPPNIFYIQSRPSHIGNAIQNISRVLEDISRVNFVQLSDKLDQALDSMNEVFGRGDLLATLKNMHTVSRDLEKSMRNLQLILSEENIKKVNSTVGNLENSAAEIRKAVNPALIGDLLKNTNYFLVDAREFLKKTERFGNEAGKEAKELRIRLDASLNRLDDSMTHIENSSRRLGNFLNDVEDDPSQFIRGRRAPEQKPQ